MINWLIRALKQQHQRDQERERQEDRLGLKIVGFLLIPVIVLVLIIFAQTLEQSTWPRAEARITSSRIVPPANEKELLSALRVDYAYELQGKKFEGSGIAMHNRDAQVLEKKQLEEYQKDKPVQIAYNPAEPSKSQLARPLAMMPYILLCTAAVLSIISYKLTRIRVAPVRSPEDE
ncbi:MAG: DUF3592 domain-containing protein [Candidatus Melainabacteria bacterium]|nr:DUF3592 domain-containing protein [Candidatus Melainabacteria bacterium]